MDYAKIKKEAWEISNKNKWNIWKPILILALISGVLSSIITGIFGDESAVGGLLNLVVSFAIIPASIGITKYVLNLIRGKSYGLDNLMEYYSNHLGTCLGLSIIISVLVCLGSIFFVIPGIILGLMYAMAFTIFIDNDELSIKECMNKSKEMMNGYKANYFMFLLSFIGWILLCLLIIPAIWVVPYIQTAELLYYEKLKEKN